MSDMALYDKCMSVIICSVKPHIYTRAIFRCLHSLPTSAMVTINKNKHCITFTTCLTRFTTYHQSCTSHSSQTSTNFFMLEAWRRNSQKRSCVHDTPHVWHIHLHHMFGTYTETHAGWVLAHRAHQSPQSSAQKHTVPQVTLQRLTCWVAGSPMEFWKIFLEWFVNIQNFGVLEKCTVCFTRLLFS